MLGFGFLIMVVAGFGCYRRTGVCAQAVVVYTGGCIIDSADVFVMVRAALSLVFAVLPGGAVAVMVVMVAVPVVGVVPEFPRYSLQIIHLDEVRPSAHRLDDLGGGMLVLVRGPVLVLEPLDHLDEPDNPGECSFS